MKSLAVILVCLVVCAAAYPYPYALPDDGYAPPPPVYGHAAPSYEPGPVGRVKMQVYRGPSDGKGYDVFAPWGFYVTQPLDAAIAPAYH